MSKLHKLLRNYKLRILRNSLQESVLYLNQLSIDLPSITKKQEFQTSSLLRTKFSKSLIWAVPPASDHGGGFRTISRFLREFDRRGISQSIMVYHPLEMFNLGHQRDLWYRNFRVPTSVKVEAAKINAINNYSTVLATGWQTLPFVLKTTPYENRIWFVQDDESNFHPTGDLHRLVTDSYRHFPRAITAGSWLKKQTTSKGVPQVIEFGFGADSIYFSPKNPNFRRRNQIIFYFQPSKPWRSPAMVLAVAREAAKKLPSWNMILVGESGLESLRLPRNIELLGAVSPVRLARLYAESKIGVVASLSNASLVPIEMISSGLKVITNTGENSTWLLEDCSDVSYVDWDLQTVLKRLLSEIQKPLNVPCQSYHSYDWETHVQGAVERVLNEWA